MRYRAHTLAAVAMTTALSTLTPWPLAAQQAPPAVSLAVPGGAVEGTLLMPGAVSGKVPVVLIIAGSGPPDRDGNSSAVPGQNNSYRMLAESLAAQGIASLRYDKRGIGASKVANLAERDLRFETFVQDAASWVSFLRNDARFSTITVLGHSEGSLIGMLAARAARADAFVSVAGVAKSATELGRLTMPILLIQGTTDVQVPVAEAKALQAAKPNATLKIVEDAEVPAATAEFVRNIYAPGATAPRRPAAQRVSLRDTVLGEVDGVRLAIEYGRPSKRGRVIWGTLVPWGKWWMPGADEATTLTTSGTIAFGDLVVPAGEYTIYTTPSASDFVMMINRDTGQYHTVYSANRDLGRVPVTMAQTPEAVEKLTFAIESRAGGGVLKLMWDDREYLAAFVVRR